LLVFAALVVLGTWQVERKAWKETLIATLDERLAAPPMALPPLADWAKLDADDEYRRVKFSATFDNGKEALVYASASAFRPDVAGTGYWVFTPAHLGDGATVMVNRGFVPDTRKDPATRAAGQMTGPIEIVGVLRFADARHWFSPNDEPARNIWYSRDPLAIAAAKSIGKVAPFYIEQEAPAPSGGLPQPGKLVVQLRDPHLGYALTWYGLALALVAVFFAWARSSTARADAQ
jgi:surfeit locus 1 family protein